ncbi:hypothetical protein EDD17DRAFT_1565843 [Pisolithus thermaeus]|nr:hypothetical protein EV401DRAFT_1912899 [Pisolithus croceorrhizus]KAI6163643.1 hypothetical protein EDD17DRAFT_1565843 [Pisolithus thermaeus]
MALSDKTRRPLDTDRVLGALSYPSRLIIILAWDSLQLRPERRYHAMQPSRWCISFIVLVLLKTGIVRHPPGPNDERPVTIDYNQMATAQKLLLFWRKTCCRLPATFAVLGG